eukprot:6296170-Alexandrium_andersonii.AAC.1
MPSCTNPGTPFVSYTLPAHDWIPPCCACLGVAQILATIETISVTSHLPPMLTLTSSISAS